MRLNIKINLKVDDWDQYVDDLELLEKTARADDYDDETETVTLIVDREFVDDVYHPVGGRYPVEIGDRVEFIEEVGICVHSCKWNGHDILNADEVCAEIEGLDYVN